MKPLESRQVIKITSNTTENFIYKKGSYDPSTCRYRSTETGMNTVGGAASNRGTLATDVKFLAQPEMGSFEPLIWGDCK
jgi:hypothetical protein